MIKPSALFFAAILAAASVSPAFAQTANNAMSGNAMSGNAMSGDSAGNHAMTKPTCPANDPVVGVNTATKTYMTHDQMKAKMAGMTPDQMHASMAKNNVKLMCQSAATAMGAKPMSASHM